MVSVKTVVVRSPTPSFLTAAFRIPIAGRQAHRPHRRAGHAVAVAALTEEGHVGRTYDLNGAELLDGHAQAAAVSSLLGRPGRYLDVLVDDFGAI